MKTQKIFAHRGLHENIDKHKNTKDAIISALQENYSVELDIRDSRGRLYISHDPIKSTVGLISIEELVNEVNKIGSQSQLAINIKADGISHEILEALQRIEDKSLEIFVFDMSRPEQEVYKKKGLNVYTRASEYEKVQSGCKGVWVDSFEGKLIQIEIAKYLISEERRFVIVSDELHGRCKEKLWEKIKELQIHKYEFFGLCTDYAREAINFFR